MTMVETYSQFHQHFMRAHFSYKSKLSSFSLVTNPKHSFVIFGAKILFKKRTRKTLMKLTPKSTKFNNHCLIQMIISKNFDYYRQKIIINLALATSC